MTKKIKTLLIDDHPLITDSLKRILNTIEGSNNLEFIIHIAHDCDSANFELEKSFDSFPFDLVFLDIRIPPSKDKKLLSGEDIGIKIRSEFTNTKIIIFTSLLENYRLNSLLRNVNPDGLLLKSDITFNNLFEAINTVIEEPPFYSKQVIKLLRKQAANDTILDNIDRRLLYELSIGARMKDLPNIIPLTIAGIERRKRKLKEAFNTQKDDDKELLEIAREKGFI